MHCVVSIVHLDQFVLVCVGVVFKLLSFGHNDGNSTHNNRNDINNNDGNHNNNNHNNNNNNNNNNHHHHHHHHVQYLHQYWHCCLITMTRMTMKRAVEILERNVGRIPLRELQQICEAQTQLEEQLSTSEAKLQQNEARPFCLTSAWT